MMYGASRWNKAVEMAVGMESEGEGKPDCRKKFCDAFELSASRATKENGGF